MGKIFSCGIILLLLLIDGCKNNSENLTLRVQVDFALQELNNDFCWFHPRLAAIPDYDQIDSPKVIMTIQKHLVASEYYSGMYYMLTDDLGESSVTVFECSFDGETLVLLQ